MNAKRKLAMMSDDAFTYMQDTPFLNKIPTPIQSMIVHVITSSPDAKLLKKIRGVYPQASAEMQKILQDHVHEKGTELLRLNHRMEMLEASTKDTQLDDEQSEDEGAAAHLEEALGWIRLRGCIAHGKKYLRTACNAKILR